MGLPFQKSSFPVSVGCRGTKLIYNVTDVVLAVLQCPCNSCESIMSLSCMSWMDNLLYSPEIVLKQAYGHYLEEGVVGKGWGKIMILLCLMKFHLSLLCCNKVVF